MPSIFPAFGAIIAAGGKMHGSARMLVAATAALAAIAACESHPDVDFPGGSATPEPPPPPMSLAVVPELQAVDISWVPSDSSANSFVVYVASTSWTGAWSASLPSAQRLAGVACCGHLVAGLENDTTYWFSVSGVNSAGEGALASQIQSTPPGWVGTILTGTTSSEEVADIALDSEGNIFIGGSTTGEFPGFNNAGARDPFVMKLLPNGALDWVVQYELTGDQVAKDIAVGPAGDVFVVGDDLTIVQGFNWSLANDGSLRHYQPFGSGFGIETYGVAVVGTTAVIAGANTGDLFGSTAGGIDAWLAYLNADGTVQTGIQFGTSGTERARDVAPSSDGGLYVTGETFGAFPTYTNQGLGDIFLLKRDELRQLDWLQQVGGTGFDYSSSVAELLGNVYIAGRTSASIASQPFHGQEDLLLYAFETDGDPQYVRLRGADGTEDGACIAVDTPNGFVYLAGNTTDLQNQDAVLIGQFDQSNSGADNNTWMITEDLGPFTDVSGIAVRGGSLYVTGSVELMSDFEIFLMKISTSGEVE